MANQWKIGKNNRSFLIANNILYYRSTYGNHLSCIPIARTKDGINFEYVNSAGNPRLSCIARKIYLVADFSQRFPHLKFKSLIGVSNDN